MKMIFENRFEWTIEDTNAIYYRSILKNSRYRLAFIFLALSIMCITALIVCYRPSALVTVVLGFFLIAIVSSVIIAFMKHQKVISNEYAQLVKSCGGKAPELTIQVSEEAITSKNRNGKGGGVYFDDILYVHEDKERFILAANTREIYVLKKKSFTKGTSEEFRDFLLKKGLKVK